MSSLQDKHAKYSQMVDALEAAFPDQASALHANETMTHFLFATQIKDPNWLLKHLPYLVDALDPAGFRILLTVAVHDYLAALEVKGHAAALLVNTEEPTVEDVEDPGELPPAAVGKFDMFRELTLPGKIGISFVHIHDLLMELEQLGVHIKLAIELTLNKTVVSKDITRNIALDSRPKLVVYLFPEALLRDLNRLTLNSYENNFFTEGRRSLIVVFNLRGQAKSNYLAILGRDAYEAFAQLLNEPLDHEDVYGAEQKTEFRAVQGVWLFPTSWLLPETFDMKIEHSEDRDIWDNITKILVSVKALLSIIFLADNVSQTDSIYRVEFAGFGRAQIPVSSALLQKERTSLPSLYQLYLYSYDRLSADKLEIAQQFLSLIAEDLPSLCNKAGEVREATKKTYDRALVDKVSDYFDARRKIQDRISEAVTETANKIIGLSRDISSDLYKVAGIIAAATIGALLDANITTWAALLAALVIGAYALIVLRFHLPTISESFVLEMQQHTIYIRSFDDILSSTEIDDFVKDPRLKQTRVLFDTKFSEARTLYLVAFFLAIAVAVVAALILFGNMGVPPEAIVPTSTITPLPT